MGNKNQICRGIAKFGNQSAVDITVYLCRQTNRDIRQCKAVIIINIGKFINVVGNPGIMYTFGEQIIIRLEYDNLRCIPVAL